jgi:hypothetical protein
MNEIKIDRSVMDKKYNNILTRKISNILAHFCCATGGKFVLLKFYLTYSMHVKI